MHIRRAVAIASIVAGAFGGTVAAAAPAITASAPVVVAAVHSPNTHLYG
jgi:hypothetical protein